MTNASDRRPFSMPYVGHASSVSGTTMVSRAPWPAPVGKYFVLRKLVVSYNASTLVSGAAIGVWDQDLSNTTPIGRGSGGGPLITVPLVPSWVSGTTMASMTVLDIDACPQESFYAGLTVGTVATNSGISISFEADVV